ncbi:MAG: hypothetical protein ABI663_17040 [Chryseolinea sp.]
MLLDKDNNILVFTCVGELIHVNSIDLSIIKTRKIFGASINLDGDFTTCSSGYALDKQENILYFFRNAPQPAAAPYSFSSYNLSTDSIRLVSNTFMGASTIAFDEKKKLILMGWWDRAADGQPRGKIKLYTTSGTLSEEITVPNIIEKILIE